MKKQLHLSKSLYTRGLQCSKSLWLKKYKKDVLTPPDASIQDIFATGDLVGGLACELFPNGREVPFEGTSFAEKIALTQQWIDEGIEDIFEATFSYQDILVMVDILHKMPDGSWEIYEVKSATWGAKKKLKDIAKYIDDASIQYYVLHGCGLNISKTSISLLNSHYTFKNQLDIEALFTHVDVSKEVNELQADIPDRLRIFQQCLSDTEHEPDVEIGAHCKKPYLCDAYDYCWKKQKNIPEYSVFNIFTKAKPFNLYKKGIVEIQDIPETELTSENQRLVVDAYKNRATMVDKPAIQHFLDGLSYPIYHLDFETFSTAVPQWNHQCVYQQICVQYSLHIEHADGSLEHQEFLADEHDDPRIPLIEQLVAAIPDDATVLVFNEGFEKTRLKEMADDFPQYKEKLMAIYDNIVDLAKPFKNKLYYDYRMKGGYSIKTVMPLLAPDMGNAYQQLNLIHNGGEAMNIFPKLASMDAQERLRYRKALLEYCKLDTLSMVKVLDGLKKSIV